MVNTDVGCGKGALTDFLGLMLQALLVGLAFTCLIGVERFDVEFTDDDCVALEPRDPRLNS